MRDLMEYATFCEEMLSEISIPFAKVENFTVNTRARRWGQCKLHNGKYYIEINSTLLDERNGEDGLINTLIHELLHTCPYCMNHGVTWKKYASIVNDTYGYKIQRCDSQEEKEVVTGNLNYKPREYKYLIYCKECGQVVARRKRACDLTERPGLYRHGGSCGGALYCEEA